MRGGQSNPDLTVRSVVYPSFGIGEPGPAYILGSYAWPDDADKWSHASQQEMLEAALRDVARLHGEEIVRSEYLGHGKAVVWNRQRLAGGGFEFLAAGHDYPGLPVNVAIEARMGAVRINSGVSQVETGELYWGNVTLEQLIETGCSRSSSS